MHSFQTNRSDCCFLRCCSIARLFWGMRREILSQSFTTRVDELWTVFCKRKCASLSYFSNLDGDPEQNFVMKPSFLRDEPCLRSCCARW
ncbi:DUF4113 domain-containing protein [Pseudomonas sp. GZD-222]|uniref:DUF4113 domain-containing protein n=1 Tax=Pseudomonas sp. GZD-222 TaxID=3404805 RepID=UPI003BB76269